MTKAPERIWVKPDLKQMLDDMESMGTFEEFGMEPVSDSLPAFVSYTRTDRALALVAAAYEDAAKIGSIWPVQTEIRARTPDDATAALERVTQEVAEQAAKLADEWYHNSGHGSPGDGIRAALITEGQSDGE